MLANFEKVKRSGIYGNFVCYFVPVFTVFVFGYYARDQVAIDAFGASRLMGLPVASAVALIAFAALGKIIGDVMSYVFLFLQYCFYLLSERTHTKGGSVGRLGRFFASLVPFAPGKEVSEGTLYAFFKDNEILHAWYGRLVTAETAFRTGTGALLLGFILFRGERVILLCTFIILLLLAWGARQRLAHAELEIEASAKGSA